MTRPTKLMAIGLDKPVHPNTIRSLRDKPVVIRRSPKTGLWVVTCGDKLEVVRIEKTWIMALAIARAWIAYGRQLRGEQ